MGPLVGELVGMVVGAVVGTTVGTRVGTARRKASSSSQPVSQSRQAASQPASQVATSMAANPSRDAAGANLWLSMLKVVHGGGQTLTHLRWGLRRSVEELVQGRQAGRQAEDEGEPLLASHASLTNRCPASPLTTCGWFACSPTLTHIATALSHRSPQVIAVAHTHARRTTIDNRASVSQPVHQPPSPNLRRCQTGSG